jgi:hypothetical protein
MNVLESGMGGINADNCCEIAITLIDDRAGF